LGQAIDGAKVDQLLGGGVRVTITEARGISAETPIPAALLAEFVSSFDIRALNVAGPRASNEPEIAGLVTRTLDEAFPIETAESTRK
jgi:hypothetical protein